MAFMGRGGVPNIEHNNTGYDGNTGENTENNTGIHTHHHMMGYWYYRRFFYYIPLDNTYVIMQMIVTFIILIVGIITFVVTYESTIIDPI